MFSIGSQTGPRITCPPVGSLVGISRSRS
jgi:hypothetical protein